MKILFFYKEQESLGIQYLSSTLKKKGHEVELIFNSGFDSYMGFYNLESLKGEKNNEKLINQIRIINPDVVALSCVTPMYPYAKKMASLVKKNFDIPVIMGGIHPTSVPEHVLKNPDIDMIYIGEGEEGCIEDIDKIEKGEDYSNVPNLWMKKDGEIVKNPLRPLITDLDSIPFPDRDLFYPHTFAGILTVLSGRGCPYRCTFCFNNQMERIYGISEKHLRRRSIKNVMDELIYFNERYRIKKVFFADDIFTLNHDWVTVFCDEYARKINAPFLCQVHPSTVNPKVLKTMKDASCECVIYGLDSGNDFVRNKIMKKNVNREKILETVKMVRESGIKLFVNVIYGMVWENREQMSDTLDFLKKIKCDGMNASIFFPYPETEACEYGLKNGYIDNETMERVNEGLGTTHGSSLINIDDKPFAETMRNLTPAYNKIPFLRPFFDYLIRKKAVAISKLIYVFTGPFVYSTWGEIMFREMFFIFVKAILPKKLFVKKS